MRQDCSATFGTTPSTICSQIFSEILHPCNQTYSVNGVFRNLRQRHSNKKSSNICSNIQNPTPQHSHRMIGAPCDKLSGNLWNGTSTNCSQILSKLVNEKLNSLPQRSLSKLEALATRVTLELSLLPASRSRQSSIARKQIRSCLEKKILGTSTSCSTR